MKTESKGQVFEKFALIVCTLTILTGCGLQNTAGSMGSLPGTVSGVPVDLEEKESAEHDYTRDFKKVDADKLSRKGEETGQLSFSADCQRVDEIYENCSYIIRGAVIDSYLTVVKDSSYIVLDVQVTDSIKGKFNKSDKLTVLILHDKYMQAADTYPQIGEEYVLGLADSKVSEGVYDTVNVFETVFKKEKGDNFVRVLPSIGGEGGYYGCLRDGSREELYLKNDVSFDYEWFKTTCEVQNSVPSANPSEADLKTDYVDLKKLPANYSEDMALQDGVVINSLWEVLNTEYLYQFLEMYSQEEDAMVRVMCYTIEGDPIITDISYNNEIITMTVDSSRDKFSSDDKFYTKDFKYLVEKDGLLYLSNHRKWKDNVEDDFYLFANIDDKQIWKNHLDIF